MKIFLDLDGVLVDFNGGVQKWYNITFTEEEQNVWEYDLKSHGFDHDAFWQGLGYDFWKNLEWTLEGKEIFSLVQAYNENITIMTAPPWSSPGAVDGKKEWMKKNLHYIWKKRRFAFTSRKDLFAHPGAILIDDKEENIDEFRKAGGYGILVPRQWNKLRGVDILAWLDKSLDDLLVPF